MKQIIQETDAQFVEKESINQPNNIILCYLFYLHFIYLNYFLIVFYLFYYIMLDQPRPQ
jgi:hypothetical protein